MSASSIDPERLDRPQRALVAHQRDRIGRQEEVGAIDVDDRPQERVQLAVTFGHQVPVRRIRSLPLLGQRSRLRHLPVRIEPDEPGRFYPVCGARPAPRRPRSGWSGWPRSSGPSSSTRAPSSGPAPAPAASRSCTTPATRSGVIGGSVPVARPRDRRRPRRLRRRDRPARRSASACRHGSRRSCSAARSRT